MTEKTFKVSLRLLMALSVLLSLALVLLLELGAYSSLI